MDRDGFEHGPHTSFGQVGRPETSVLQLGQNLRSDAACDEDAAGGQRLERQVASLGAVEAAERLQGAPAERVARARGFGDRRRSVASPLLDGRGELPRQWNAVQVRQGLRDVDQPGAGDEPLPGNVLVAVHEEAEDRDLQIVARGERAVPSLGREHFPAAAQADHGGRSSARS